FLGKLLAKNGVKVRLGVKIKDYVAKDDVVLYFEDGQESFDYVVFATGGCSQSKLGSDGSLFPIFKKHGYKVIAPKPGLCPIRTYEKTKSISGQRHEAKVTVTIKGIVAREEEGEVLFKDDGLSGIVIFNIASFINHLDSTEDVSIYLDLFPKVTLTALTMDLFASMKSNPTFFMDAYLTEPMKDYILKAAGVVLDGKIDKGICFKIAKVMKQLPFRFKESYGFDNSQVTIGGVSVENVGEKLRSKIEKNVSFAGEVLDIDGLCGDHNLTWCLVSALAVAESFLAFPIRKSRLTNEGR
ncbi:MAG: NAD(P)/FAD-dependent oxidoreductase, partial [Bacilli bacterium]|nr:NAD(P)/FAD-dependent oxidoreductase [Bacilli bacterium]